mmetsp:Transcript_25734/g.70774  ORF Transcript_25734/g.70774 Transcript_25734/m.70774 type:complete len:169 (-) Transcript_25734:686-1192(-)
MAVLPETQEREARLECIHSPEASSKNSIVHRNNDNGFLFCNATGGDNRFRSSSPRTPSLVSESSSSSEDSFRLYYYTRAEIERHNTEASAWIVAGDDIYDVTDYVEHHPGGKYSIMKKAGGKVDCTRDLLFHSKSGQKYWKQFLIGKVTKVASKNGHAVEKEWWKFWE